MRKRDILIAMSIFCSQLFALAAGAAEIHYYTGRIIPTPQQVSYYEDYIPITSKTGEAISAILIGEKASSLEKKAAVELQEMITLLAGKETSHIPILKEGEDYRKYSTIISIGRLEVNKLNQNFVKDTKLNFPNPTRDM